MSKTKITKTKQKELLKYLVKYVEKVDDSLKIDKFYDEIKKNITTYLDNCVVLFFGDEIYTRNDWLKNDLGLNDQAYLNYFPIITTLVDPLHIMHETTSYSTLVIPGRWWQRVPKCNEAKGDLTPFSLQGFITQNPGHEPFISSLNMLCTAFVDKFYKVATPFIKLINESKYCEDIYKVWDDPEVYKILFPQKTYALSTISEHDINNIKMFVRMAKQNENNETNKESEVSES
ncbi:MAG: hypothetical protein J6T10_20320 [Methanobrevibacter sp.]|nr:hypothetical protein [Methanobrevibacter sp.]